MGFTDSTKLVPEQTVAFISVPDLPRAAFRWPQTTLAKIGAEPQVKAFFEKPFEVMTKTQGSNDAGDILMKLKPGHIFAALVEFTPQQSAAVIGFQFWGSGSDCEAAFVRLRQQVNQGQSLPDVLQKEDYHGDEIVASVHGGITLYTAHRGHWGFITNNLAAIKDVLDRSAGRSEAKSLADSAIYKETFHRLPKDADVVIFTQPQALVEALLMTGATMGAQIIPQQVEQIRKVEAIGATMKLDGANLRDSIFILRKDPPSIGDLTHQAMKFTTKETAIYFDFVMDLPQLFTLSQNPTLTALIKSPSFQSSQLPTLLPEAFGPECAVVLNWEEFQMSPSGTLAIQVRDQAKAEASLAELLSLFPQSNIVDLAGVKTYSFPNLQGLLANPTFSLYSGFLLVGLNPNDIQRAVVAAGLPESLEKSPAFQPALADFKTANEVFGFVDTKKIFSRGYPLARQVMIFSAAVMPGAADIIEVGKLPETETIAKHLAPIVYAQTRFPDGYLIESRGPITLNQAVLGGASAASTFFKPSTNP